MTCLRVVSKNNFCFEGKKREILSRKINFKFTISFDFIYQSKNLIESLTNMMDFSLKFEDFLEILLLFWDSIIFLRFFRSFSIRGFTNFLEIHEIIWDVFKEIFCDRREVFPGFSNFVYLNDIQMAFFLIKT